MPAVLVKSIFYFKKEKKGKEKRRKKREKKRREKREGRERKGEKGSERKSCCLFGYFQQRQATPRIDLRSLSFSSSVPFVFLHSLPFFHYGGTKGILLTFQLYVLFNYMNFCTI